MVTSKCRHSSICIFSIVFHQTAEPFLFLSLFSTFCDGLYPEQACKHRLSSISEKTVTAHAGHYFVLSLYISPRTLGSVPFFIQSVFRCPSVLLQADMTILASLRSLKPSSDDHCIYCASDLCLITKLYSAVSSFMPHFSILLGTRNSREEHCRRDKQQ